MFADAAAYVMRVEGVDDPYGSKHVGVDCAINVIACDNILIIYMSA